MSAVKHAATPAARRLAKEMALDLAGIMGTGPAGCIKARDVMLQKKRVDFTPAARAILDYYGLPSDPAQYKAAGRWITKEQVLGQLAEDKSVAITAEAPAKKEEVVYVADPQTQGKPLQGMRRIIAQRMQESLQTSPQYTCFADYDMTELLRLYHQLVPVMEKKHGFKLSLTDLFIKLTAEALIKHPIINSSLLNEKIIIHEDINIGIAVALQDGLIVPVIRQAQRISLGEVSRLRNKLVDKARTGKLLPIEYTEGTFTISNLGMYPVDYFTPIINQPESAILGIGRTVEKVAVINGKTEIRSMAGFSVTLDHRHIDGAEGARFMGTLKDLIEHPYVLLL